MSPNGLLCVTLKRCSRRFVAMSNSRAVILALALCAAASVAIGGAPAPVLAQTAAPAPDPARDATREKLRALLVVEGPKIGVAFNQSSKNLYNFAGTLTQGLRNSESIEIIISVTKSNTIGFRIYPHYKGAYINLGRVKDRADFAHRLLRYSDNNFLFWGVDDSDDTFAAFTITLESGFPSEALDTVIRSIPNLDKFVGEMRPAIDGSAAQ
ncbi:MAG TPA: hypothetical protein VJ476_05830 [Rhizomicrobium sp.]|nr:hypothetical protein [Rhizomicrobium sp.]